MIYNIKTGEEIMDNKKIEQDSNVKKDESKKIEQQMVNDFTKMLNFDIKDMLLINVAAAVFGQNKVQANLLLNTWARDMADEQNKTITKLYNDLTPQQIQKTIKQPRYMELFSACVNNVKMNFQQILDLKNVIITN